jgi:hypothetical protein
MLLWLLSLAGSTHGSDQWCSVLYGVAVGTMWFRILGFFLVQQDLGKVLGSGTVTIDIESSAPSCYLLCTFTYSSSSRESVQR